MKIGNLITESIKELKDDYQTNEKGYLTEADCVAKLFSVLSQRIKEENISFSVHLEMRPYDTKEDGTISVLGDNGKWVTQEKANDGRKIDLALIDINEGFWSEAIKKAISDQSSKELKYWRILSYPVKAFLAAIEVKVRVKGNTSRIHNDIDELEALRMINPQCLSFLVILDRCASQKDLDTIREYLEGKEVAAIISDKQMNPGGSDGNAPRPQTSCLL